MDFLKPFPYILTQMVFSNSRMQGSFNQKSNWINIGQTLYLIFFIGKSVSRFPRQVTRNIYSKKIMYAFICHLEVQ